MRSTFIVPEIEYQLQLSHFTTQIVYTFLYISYIRFTVVVIQKKLMKCMRNRIIEINVLRLSESYSASVARQFSSGRQRV